MLTSDEARTDSPGVPTTTTNGESLPSLEDEPAESDDSDDWEDEDGDDDDILDVLIADDMI